MDCNVILRDIEKRWHLTYLLVLAVIHLAGCAPHYECKDPNFPVFGTGDTGQYCEETLNSMNFSLGPRNNVEADTTLNGTIRRLSGWNEFKQTIRTLDRCPNNVCEPSQLQSLRLTKYTRHINPGIDKETHYWPAIQIEFTVPKPSFDNDYFTKAIKLTFSSDEKDQMGDPSFDEKHRLFDFSTYSYTSPDKDDTKPKRILRFPCFMGFHYEPCQTDDYNVYSLTLTSFSRGMKNPNLTVYTELTYNITVYGYYAYHPNLSKWKSTIAVALYPGNNDVDIVFDPAPDSLGGAMYTVSLVDAYTNAATKYKIVEKDGPYKLCFENTEDGVYYISIVVMCSGTEYGKYAKSHTFTIKNPTLIKWTAAHSEVSTFPVVYMSIGFCLALTFVGGLFCYHRWKATQDKTELNLCPKVCLIYSNINERNCILTQSFSTICSKHLCIQLIYDKLEGERSRVKQNGYLSWYREKFDESAAIVILWTPGSDTYPKERSTYNEFTLAITMALNSKAAGNKKLACIYFRKSHKKTVPKEIQKNARIFRIPEQTSPMVSFLYGNKRPRLYSYRLKKQLSNLKSTYLVNENTETKLQDDVEDINDNQETIPLKLRNENISYDENLVFNPLCPIHGSNFESNEKCLPMNHNPIVHKNLSTLRCINHAAQIKDSKFQDCIEDFDEIQEKHPLTRVERDKLYPGYLIFNPLCPIHGVKRKKKTDSPTNVNFTDSEQHAVSQSENSVIENIDEQYSDDVDCLTNKQKINKMHRQVFHSDTRGSNNNRTSNIESLPIQSEVFNSTTLSTCSDIGFREYQGSKPGQTVQKQMLYYPHGSRHSTNFSDVELYQSYCSECNCCSSQPIHLKKHKHYLPPDPNRLSNDQIQPKIRPQSCHRRILSLFDDEEDKIGFPRSSEDLPLNPMHCLEKERTHLQCDKALHRNAYELSLACQTTNLGLEKDSTRFCYNPDKILQRANSMDSLKSQKSQHSGYSRRSSSISSSELTESFQNFI